jgi:Carboxypeptidase regulatory-like domain
MRTALLTLLACLCALAQEKARVDGRVTNTTGKPLPRATIALVGNNRTSSQPLPPAYRTTSNPDGTYAFDDVEPNTYRIFVQRTGYLDFVFTQPDGKVICPLAEGEHKQIDIKMTAESFLTGRVTTDDGEPFPGARVNVLRPTRQQLTALPPVTAGPDGSFSIGRLRAGRYYLAAANPPSLTDTNQREIHPNHSGDDRYVTTYYPSAIDTAGATLIDLPAETELHGLDIRLRRARVFHIAGKIVQSSGAPVPNPSLTLIRPGVTDATDPMNTANRLFAIEGAFQINGLLPGTYALQAWAGSARQLQGHRSVAITDRDLDDIVVTVVPGLEIPLTVRIDDADPSNINIPAIMSQLGRFTLTATDGVNLNAMAEAKGDATWLFHNIGPGTYRMGLGGPEETYVKSIRFGERDVTNTELDTTAGGAPLVMVLSPHAAEISGVIRDSKGQPLAGTTVTLWTPGLPPHGTLDRARSTRTGADGKFRFAGLPPAEYRVAAWEQIEPGLPNVPEFHQKFDAEATTVRVAPDARETVQPVLIDRKKVEAAAAAIPF